MNQSIQSSSDSIRNIRTYKLEVKIKKCNVSSKYDSTYLKFGFIQEPGSELDPRTLCTMCCEGLSSDAMKPSKFKTLPIKTP